MRIHQVVVAAAPHDAIVNHALGLQRVLSTTFTAKGESQIFARHIDPGMADRVRPLSDLTHEASDALVYHASIGQHDVTEFLLGRPEPLVVVYHNITPAEFFQDLDPEFADLLLAGRDELVALRDKAACALGVSEYNARELRELGFANVAVSPLVGITGRIDAEPDPETLSRLEDVPGPVFLFVGQLLPHKRAEFLVQAFHILRTYLDPTAVLVLAGAQRMAACTNAIHQFVAELALPDVWMTGSVSDTELSAYYRGATAFVTATEHEGFCVPLVEAMAAGLPVIARRFAAVPDTLGTAGLLLEPEDGPAVFAEAMYRIGTDGAVREALARRGADRAAALAATDAGGTFAGHLAAILG